MDAVVMQSVSMTRAVTTVCVPVAMRAMGSHARVRRPGNTPFL